MTGDLRFDRTVSDELLDTLSNGPARHLIDVVQQQSHDAPLHDLQLRRDPKGSNPRSWATLYYGMTALLNVEERSGRYRATAHATYRAADTFDERWTAWQDRGAFEAAWPRIEAYLDAAPALVSARATSREGPVHAAISSGASDAYRVINREASPSFRDTPTRARRLAAWTAPFNAALSRRDDPPRWWPRDVRVGHSLDFLAVDIGGRLALIEAKADSASAGELSKVAVQAGVYAAMFANLLHEDPTTVDAVTRMLHQRTQLGLSRRGILHLRDERRVVPVVAIGPGRPSREVHRRMWEVASTITDAHGPNVDPIEVWYLDAAGRIVEVERAGDVAASPVP